MRAEHCLQRFETFHDARFDCFSKVSLSAYTSRVRSPLSEQRYWPLPGPLFREFETCLTLMRNAYNHSRVITRRKTGPRAVLHAIAFPPQRFAGKLPWCVALDCIVAWRMLSKDFTDADQTALDRWLAIHARAIQQQFVLQLRNWIREHGKKVRDAALVEALEIADEIEYNLDVAPSAFHGKYFRSITSALTRFIENKHKSVQAGRNVIKTNLGALHNALSEPRHITSAPLDASALRLCSVLTDRKLIGSQVAQDFVRFERAARGLTTFMKDSQEGSWPISDIGTVNAFFNEGDFGNVILRLNEIKASDVILSTHERIRILLAGDSDHSAELALRHLASRMTAPIYDGNQVHVKTLLHFFFGFLIAGIQNANVSLAIDMFEQRVNDLDDELRKHMQCTPAFCRNLWRVISADLPDASSFRFGHVYHYDYVADGDSIYRLFADVATELQLKLGSDFARRHYSEFGFLLPYDFGFPVVQLEGGFAPPQISSRIDADVAVRRRIGKTDPECAKIMRLDWSKPFDFDSDYQLLTKQPEWPRVILRRIHTEAATLLREIRKTGALAETLGERTKASRIRCPEIIRALVARRVVLECAFDTRNRIKVARMIGYPIGGARAKTDEERLARKSLSSNLGGKLDDWRLEALNWGKPKEFPGFTPDEKKYFKHYLTR